MSFGSGGGRLYDQLREIPRGVDQDLLVEWPDIIERRINEERGGSKEVGIRFKRTVNDEGRFALDMDVPHPDAMVSLRNAIQNHLCLMPTIAREFYGALTTSSPAIIRDFLN